MRTFFLASLFIMQTLQGASWYAAPDATSDGDGSIGDPWPLYIALQSGSITSGDTLYLRGGNYLGPAYISTLSGASNSYITVRSYPGEWAVITDGGSWTLNTTLNSGTTSAIQFTGSDDYPQGLYVKVDNEIIYAFDRQAPDDTWGVLRGQMGTSAASHSIGTPAYLIGDFLEQHGSYVKWMEFEITPTTFTSRVVGGASGHVLGCGLDLSSLGEGNKAINLLIHDCGQPGIGFWDQGEYGELNGNLLWGNGMYDNGTTRGNGAYCQNEGGMARVKHNIAFRNFNVGLKVFGETGPVQDFMFQENIAFDHDLFSLEGTSGSTSTSNIWFLNNVVEGPLFLAYVSTGNSHQYVISNLMVNSPMFTKEHTDSVYTNNVLLLTKGAGLGEALSGYQSTLLSSNSLDVVWDQNTYYLGDGSSAYNWTFRSSERTTTNAAGGGTLKFENDSGKSWLDWSQMDANSTYAANWPTDLDVVRVFQLDYNTNRFHIATVNTTGATNTALNLASYGFRVGERYALRDAQRYSTVIGSGRYNGGSINVPLNLTSRTALKGTITHMEDEHTNVDEPGLFNAFVLTRTPGVKIKARRPE